MQRFESPTQCYSQIWSAVHFLFFDSYSKNTLGALTYSRLEYGDVYCMCSARRKVQIESMQTKRPLCPSVQQHLVKPTKKTEKLEEEVQWKTWKNPRQGSRASVGPKSFVWEVSIFSSDTLYALAKVFMCCFTDCSKVFFSEFEA